MMTQTYADLQTAPRTVRSQEARSRQALEASAVHLEHAARHLAGASPNYREALHHSLRSIRQAYTALLEWHDRPPRADASLADLAEPAERLASMLRIYQNRALPLEALNASLQGDSTLTVDVREAIETSYYTARNTLSVVLRSLPERITEEAIWTLNRAQAIRIGRVEPAREGQEPGTAAHAAPRTLASSRPLAAA